MNIEKAEKRVAALAIEQRLRAILVCWLIATTNQNFFKTGNAGGEMKDCQKKLPGLTDRDWTEFFDAATANTQLFQDIRQLFGTLLINSGFNADAAAAGTTYSDHDCPKTIDEILALLK